MANLFTLRALMALATKIGANSSKFMGTRTNISFLGTGPQKNPLFQAPLKIKNYLQNRGSSMLDEVNDAMGYLTSGKLNTIQSEILGKNLTGIKNILHPPPLPTASVTDIAPGIAGLRRFPKESHKFFGRPLKDKDFSEIDKLVAEGKLPPAGVKGATSIGPVKGRSYRYIDEQGKTRIQPSKEWSDKAKSVLPGPGIGAFNVALNPKTGMSRAIARQILQQDTRLKLPEEVLISLRTGSKGADPLDLMRKYYGQSITNFDDFIRSVNIDAASPTEFAAMVLKNIKLTPQFAEGGLAEVLQAPRKNYAKGGWSPGAGRDERGYQSSHPSYQGGRDGQGNTLQTNLIPSPILNTRRTNYNFNLGESGVSPSFAFKYSPAKFANLRARISNQNLLESDDLNLQGNLYGAAGNLNYDVPFTKEGIQGVDLNYKNLSANIDPNKNYTVGYNKNINGWDTGVRYNSDGNIMATIGTKFNKGGLAGILEV
jgi:hypothetical protein